MKIDWEDKNRLMIITIWALLLICSFLFSSCNRYYAVHIVDKIDDKYEMTGEVLNSDSTHFILFNSNWDFVFIDTTYLGDTIVIRKSDLQPVQKNYKKILK